MTLKRMLLGLTVLVGPALTSDAAEVCGDQREPDQIRIGILHHEQSVAGRQLWSTANEELDRAQLQQGRTLCVVDAAYRIPDRGEQIVAQLLDRDLDLVIGPTDSEVYLAALKAGTTFAAKQLTLISPIVAAQFADVEESDWIFRTNLEVDARVPEMYTWLQSRGVDSIAILYDSSAFGLSAEDAFRTAVSEDVWYQATRFQEPSDLDSAIGAIMAERPAAIGILASRKDINKVHQDILRKKTSLNPYTPYLFSLIDVRPEPSTGLDMVSVGDDTEGELSFLGRTAVASVLDAINLVNTPISLDGWPTDVRDALTGDEITHPIGTASRRPPRVLSGTDLAEHTPGWFAKLWQPADVVQRRYGYRPGINILLVFGLVVFLSRRDLLRWNDEHTIDWTTRKVMIKVVALNLLTAFIVFFFMLNRSLIEWSSVSGAIMVGVGYPALLKSTLGQGKTGKALGLAKRYDEYLHGLNDEIMLSKYKNSNRRMVVDLVAMTNPPVKMRNTLKAMYHEQSEERHLELMAALDRELEDARTDVFKLRTIYARRIERTHNWNDLVKSSFVPPGDEKDLIEIDMILQAAVEHCRRNDITVDDVKTACEQRMTAWAATTGSTSRSIAQRWPTSWNIRRAPGATSDAISGGSSYSGTSRF